MFERAVEIDGLSRRSTREGCGAAGAGEIDEAWDDERERDDLDAARGISCAVAIGGAMGLVSLWLVLQWLPLIVEAVRAAV